MFSLQSNSFFKKTDKIAVVGLGYVGLPLAVALSEHFSVIGFDISRSRVRELNKGLDHTREVEEGRLKNCGCEFSTDPGRLRECGLIIVAVPTPIDDHRRPDLGPILSSCRTVGRNMPSGCAVVFESTVYPGLTQEECVPRLEEYSGLKNGREFWVGYSPERINPGDKKNTLKSIVKVVAGQEPAVTDFLAEIYGAVVRAGVHRAPDIRTAEAAKVIENTQRDLNIALMNELALIFDQMGIDTREVLKAAGTKWNFLPFSPGLVGGHCIGVDPYYLTFKAEALGYHPQVILSGRRINDYMGKFVAERTVKEMIKRNCRIRGARIGVMGLAFKENVPDLRNTRVVDIIREFESYCVEVLVHDPLVDAEPAFLEYGIKLREKEELRDLDALVLAVPHNEFLLSPEEISGMFKDPENGVLADVRGGLDKEKMQGREFCYWRL